MITSDKDLEALRAQYEAVSGRLSKLSIISLSAILLLVIPFSRACQQASGEDINKKVQEINQLSEISKQCPQLSYIFLLFPKPSHCDTPLSYIFKRKVTDDSALESPSNLTETAPETTQPTDPDTQGGSGQTIVDQQRKAAEDAERERLREEARNKQRALAESLDKNAHEMFSVKPSLLGADLEFDLRYWIFLLPFIIWVSTIHFSILRKKLSLLKDVAASLLSQAKADEVGTIDKLMFLRKDAYKSTPFLSHPARFEVFLYVTCFTLPVIYLFISSYQFWGYWEPKVTLYFTEIILLLSYYALAYTHMVNGAMDEQVKEFLGAEPHHSTVELIWRRLKKMGRAVARLGRFKPRISLFTGSLLVLSTLFLATASSCAGQPRSGYELVIGRENVYWFTTDNFLAGGFVGTYLGRWYYILCLALALYTLVIIIPSVNKGSLLLRKKRLAKLASRLSASLAFFMLAEVSFVSFLNFSLLSDVIRTAAFLLPVLLWNVMALSESEHQRVRARWPRVRNIIAAMYVPGALLGVQELYLQLKGRFTGVPVFFVGIVLIAFGYIEIYSRSVTFELQTQERDERVLP